MGGLGQFAALRGGLARKREGVFEEGFDTPMHTMEVARKQSTPKLAKKKNISYTLIRTCTYAYQGIRNVRFSEILACFVFLLPPFRDSPFYLITDELRNIHLHHIHNFFRSMDSRET